MIRFSHAAAGKPAAAFAYPCALALLSFVWYTYEISVIYGTFSGAIFRKESYNMKKIAIITGASSGMGKVFAETINTYDTFDEVWVIARRLDHFFRDRHEQGNH